MASTARAHIAKLILKFEARQGDVESPRAMASRPMSTP